MWSRDWKLHRVEASTSKIQIVSISNIYLSDWWKSISLLPNSRSRARDRCAFRLRTSAPRRSKTEKRAREDRMIGIVGVWPHRREHIPASCGAGFPRQRLIAMTANLSKIREIRG